MLPTFVVIGAMKGGTSSLYQYLGAHPEICMSSKKETNFFIAKKDDSLGLAWYESLYESPARQCGEASPNYSKWPLYPGVPARMHAILPQARLIYVLRDPIERMISHYGHRVSKQIEPRPIDVALQPSSVRYLAPSQYHTQLSQFRRYYPLERILVVSSEELRDERRATLRRIFEFLDVDPNFDATTFDVEYHRTALKFKSRKTPWQKVMSALGMPGQPPTRPLPPRQVSEQTRQTLIDCLRPEIESLRRVTGQPFDHWCV